MLALKSSLKNRRSFWRGAAGALAAGFWADETLDAAVQNINTQLQAVRPEDHGPARGTVARAPMTCPLIRIDTNQGIYGLGEVRDGASKTYALMLKSRLLGENPCNVDKIFRKIKQFGFHGRQGGGVCGVEMALWDLAGKAYEVPVYQMLGGKFRDRIRCYADTTESHDPAGVRQAPESPQGPGVHLAQNGPRHRPARAHARAPSRGPPASPSSGGSQQACTSSPASSSPPKASR